MPLTYWPRIESLLSQANVMDVSGEVGSQFSQATISSRIGHPGRSQHSNLGPCGSTSSRSKFELPA